MRILDLTSPGRFPTASMDPGLWWDAVAGSGRHELMRYSANAAWWKIVCSARMKELALAPLSWLARLKRLALWRSRDIALAEDGRAAGLALESLTTLEPYRSAVSYIATLTPLARYLSVLNSAQDEFEVAVDFGAKALGPNYLDSASLVKHSRRDGLLSRTVAEALAEAPIAVDLVLMRMRSPEDLLTGLISARHLRARNPGVHISLIDHGHEHFSLQAHMTKLRAAGTLDGVFDSIIVSKDDRDILVPALVAALEAGRPVRGYLTRADFPGVALPRPGGPLPGPLPAFCPEPVLRMRLSARRCYWSRCAYCAHNSKYDDRGAPSRTEVPAALDRVSAFLAAGYSGYINFEDEALSPTMLRALAEEILRRGLKLRWVCRSKFELAHDDALFELLAASGCYEIQFGLETTSARVLKLMDKYTEGVDEERLSRAFRAMAARGIGVQVNLFGGFPGDALADTEGSVEFIIREFRTLRGASFFLSAFTLLPDTPVASLPARFGVKDVVLRGDIAQACEYALEPSVRESTEEVIAALPRLYHRLQDELGWGRLAEEPVAALVKVLYSGSAHGCVFKSRADNPFALPLTISAA